MSNTNVIPFDFQSHAVRTVLIDNCPWFIAKDIALALEYSNPRKAIADHVDPEDKADVTIRDGSQNRTLNAINESGMYSLVLRSRKPEAKKFKRWVTSEVLPAIRKTGRYNQTPNPYEGVFSPAKVMMYLEDGQITCLKKIQDDQFLTSAEVLKKQLREPHFFKLEQLVEIAEAANSQIARYALIGKRQLQARKA